MDRAEAIKAMKSLQDNLGVDRSEENLTTEAATHEIRTETHGVCSDLISREAAREAIEKLMEIHFDRQVVLAKARDAIVSLPSAVCNDCIWTVCNYNKVDWDAPPADTDMSEYSDRLWKAAYERGKAEGYMSTDEYCNNCPYISWDGDFISRSEILAGIDTTYDNPWDTDEVVAMIENAPSVTSKPIADCISRQQVTDEIKRWRGYLDEDMIERINTMMNMIPPATPTERTEEAIEELNYMRQRNAQLETMLHAQKAISADAVQVVRCKDCKYYEGHDAGWCPKLEKGVFETFFCAIGKENEHD